ncbi:MAG: hypothetical protein QOJ65_1003 [Fimbriimonadaceae bacterium]|jgi:hypothetical protein|nr:hypothetical protein [Fimbriimonadaceae bacterium]
MSTLYLLSGLLMLLCGFACTVAILLHAAMNEAWNRSVVWLLTGAGFVYYVLFEFDSRFKWPVTAGAIGGIALGAKLFMMGSGMQT